jgi:hypothetical protein
MIKKGSNLPKTPRLSAEDKKWRAQEDLRIMQRSQEIASDAQRLKAAQKEAQEQVKALQKVASKK